jgi:hypothetical protein
MRREIDYAKEREAFDHRALSVDVQARSHAAGDIMQQPEKSAADQVKDAAWAYTQRTIILLLVFGGGVFLGYQLWGSGEMGQPALAERVAKLDLDFNRVKNEREDCQKVLQVTQTRKEAADKELAALKAKAAGTP